MWPRAAEASGGGAPSGRGPVSCSGILERFRGERDAHRCAGAELADQADLAAHGPHKATGRIQADAAAVRRHAPRIGCPVELLEGPTLRLVVHPATFVPDGDLGAELLLRT